MGFRFLPSIDLAQIKNKNYFHSCTFPDNKKLPKFAIENRLQSAKLKTEPNQSVKYVCINLITEQTLR